MKIITVDREFGSGGRELGKRLADALKIPCYDQEIIDEVAKLHGLDPNHVEHISESDIRAVYPITIGRRFAMMPTMEKDRIKILVTQQEVIRKLAEAGSCVVIGRCADIILQDLCPFNLFVYANEQSKLSRCMEREKNGQNSREILARMKKIDRERASHRELLANSKWGNKEVYHLCVDTSEREIKTLIPGLVEYIRCWYQE